MDLQALLRLHFVPGVGPNKLRALISKFGSPQNVFQASFDRLASVVGQKTAENIAEYDGQENARLQIEKMQNCGVRLITFWDNEYPEPLKQIFDPPVLLFIRGTLLQSDNFAIGIVGTRSPSNYGRIMTEKLTAELANQGFTIVSGLAYGIDTLAHNTALKSGVRTLAILGSGADVIYPYENKNLAERIAESGAILSEYPMGAKPDWMNFPRRNRIICGMSLGTLVIEAGMKSGALITAAMAVEQNREVFAVPGNIDSPNSVGTNALIKQGAKLVASVDDILEELQPQLPLFQQRKQTSHEDIDLNDDEKKVFSFLSHEPIHIDALALKLNQNTAKALAVLLSLELKNLVKQLAGKYFVKV
ncbi:MAG: DNA-processing protein DprA [bacterium]